MLDVSHRQCKNGHGICSACVTKLTICPTCQESFVQCKPTLTNQLLERLPRLCPFADRGCPEMLLVKGHEQFCEFRLTECKMVCCKWEGSVKDLLAHLNEKHDQFLSENQTTFPQGRVYINLIKTKDFNSYSPIQFKNKFFGSTATETIRQRVCLTHSICQ
uniref:RING-type E3 ubiquitin transferase n=1 Tax=Graphocephala atropunctata TaxID=36148 RepID=A0A1B6LL56_9HEMI